MPYLASVQEITLADKIYKTKGVVLRPVKYGDTSIVVSIFTELFGLQSYIVNGVRSASKKSGGRAAFFQPATLLDMEVYHNEFKQLNRIREYRIAGLNENIFSHVLKNGVALYMVELLGMCLREPECNSELFAFIEDSLIHLNKCSDAEMANFPVFFALHLSGFFGFFPGNQIRSKGREAPTIFDMQNGVFTDELPEHSFYLEPAITSVLSELALVLQPRELAEIRTNSEVRRKILEALEIYYSLHIQDFGRLKTVPVLKYFHSNRRSCIP